jgi:hypothetical protein
MTTPQRHQDKIRKLATRKETKDTTKTIRKKAKKKASKNEQEQNTTDNNRWMVTSYNNIRRFKCRSILIILTEPCQTAKRVITTEEQHNATPQAKKLKIL